MCAAFAVAPLTTNLQFKRLNDGWNAEPNAPDPFVYQEDNSVGLLFALNAFLYPVLEEGDVGMVRFTDCSRFRLGATNDEGWYLGQCRYSKSAPKWGEFYELIGVDPAADHPIDWVTLSGSGERHFLFYLRDQTFECFARDWTFQMRNARP